MRGFWARSAAKPYGVASILIVAAGLALSGCSTVDDMLFGSGEEPPPASQTAEAGTLPPTAGQTGVSYATGGAYSVSVAPVTVSSGTDTGTAVNKTIQQLRGQVAGISQRVSGYAQRLSDIRNANASSATAYQSAKGHILARLQMGTTRGNPELVQEWNSAQSALDQLSGNINTLNALGTDVSNDASSAHYALDQVVATFNVSGAVDEDHRQLSVLEDETNQTIIVIDRVLKDVSDDLQRQTTYVGNERANLTALANSIKNGELYSGGGASLLTPSSYRPGARDGGTNPIATIPFSRSAADYRQSLYTTLNSTLASQPNANFRIVAVSPTRSTVSGVQSAQTAAKRRAQGVLQAMTEMGVPASRLSISSATDPNLSAGEVRVFAR